MMMNGWFLAAGALLAAAFFVHVFSGNRFYSAARPDAATAPSGAYEAWLMGRCGVQMISVDLFLCTAFLLLLGTSVLPRNFALERGGQRGGVPAAAGVRRLVRLLAGVAAV